MRITSVSFGSLWRASGSTRIKSPAGTQSQPVTSAAVLLGMLPLVYLLFAELISPLGYFVAAFAYV